MISDEEILERGMDCLMDNLGILEAERFVSLVWKERDKYNKWKQEYDSMTPEEFRTSLEEFIKQHPDDNIVAKERAL